MEGALLASLRPRPRSRPPRKRTARNETKGERKKDGGREKKRMIFLLARALEYLHGPIMRESDKSTGKAVGNLDKVLLLLLSPPLGLLSTLRLPQTHPDAPDRLNYPPSPSIHLGFTSSQFFYREGRARSSRISKKLEKLDRARVEKLKRPRCSGERSPPRWHPGDRNSNRRV